MKILKTLLITAILSMSVIMTGMASELKNVDFEPNGYATWETDTNADVYKVSLYKDGTQVGMLIKQLD